MFESECHKNRSREQEAVLAGWVLAIIRAMQVKGIAFETICEQTNIDPELLKRGGNRYSQEEVNRLWLYAKNTIKDPSFGLTVAQQVRPATFHVVGHSMSCSVTLYRALQRFTRYSRLISDAVTAALIQRNDTVVLEFHFDMSKQTPIYHSFDTVLASVVYFLRWIAGWHIKPLAIYFRHKSPHLDPAFHDFFGCPIHYGSALDSIIFTRADLDKAVLSADEELASLLDDIASRDLDIRMDGRFTVRVRDALMAQFSEGSPTKAKTAKMLFLTERTLLRRLKEEGLTFTVLLNQLREQLAYQYIRQGSMSLNDVSLRLGFLDYGAFSRAFTRWTGTRPSTVIKAEPEPDFKKTANRIVSVNHLS